MPRSRMTQVMASRQQQAALNLGCLLHVPCHHTLGLLDLSQTRVLQADRRDVGHHGEQVQVLWGEVPHDAGESTYTSPMTSSLVCSGAAIRLFTFCTTIVMLLARA